jgi:taurine dioxygenase
MSLRIRRLSYTLGAEISGVDIRNPLDKETCRQIHTAFLEYGVLLFRGQSLTQAQHVAFGRNFGQLDDNEELPRTRHPEYPQIIVHKPVPNGKTMDKYAGKTWHSDQ